MCVCVCSSSVSVRGDCSSWRQMQNFVKFTCYPETPCECPLCGFYTDTNSHALNGCRQLKGLYIERHDRCVDLIKTELDKTIVTDYCQVFHDQRIDFDGFNGTELMCNKPDMHGLLIMQIAELL